MTGTVPGSKPYRDPLRAALALAGLTASCLTEQVAADTAHQGLRPLPTLDSTTWDLLVDPSDVAACPRPTATPTPGPPGTGCVPSAWPAGAIVRQRLVRDLGAPVRGAAR